MPEITQERLDKLEKAYHKLIALENGGVDGWEFYSEALSELDDEE